jgi:hypothetical protein
VIRSTQTQLVETQPNLLLVKKSKEVLIREKIESNSTYRITYPGSEDLEVKEEKDRPSDDWFSLVDAGKERSLRPTLTW